MYTDFDKNIYNILKHIKSNNNFENAIMKFSDSYNINHLNFIITQMVTDGLIDGVVIPTDPSEKGKRKFIKSTTNVYITRKGYSFMKSFKLRHLPFIHSPFCRFSAYSHISV